MTEIGSSVDLSEAAPELPAEVRDAVPPVSFYASWGRRFAAWFVDGVVVGTLAWLPAVVVSVLSLQDNEGLDFLAWSAVFVVPLAYFTACHGGGSGQTPGKRLLGIAVRRSQSLGRLGYPRAAARFGATFVFWLGAGVLALVDCLWPLGQRENRALHDLVAGSVVVRL
jgi:uncharacterized RDD family membrane protein YckC